MRSHCIGWHHPSTFSELVGNCELIKVMAIVRIEAECNDREPEAAALAQDNETQESKLGRKVICGSGQVEHNASVSALSQTKKLIVLSNNLTGTFAKVQCERRLVGAKVIDVEDEFLWQEFRRSPEDPPDARIDQTILVAGDI